MDARQLSAVRIQRPRDESDWKAGWTYRGSFSGGRAELRGMIQLLPQPHSSRQVYVAPLPPAPFTPGTIVWGRVRKIGTGGEVGGWSDPAQIRVA